MMGREAPLLKLWRVKVNAEKREVGKK